MSTNPIAANETHIGATSQLLAAAARANSDKAPDSDVLLVKVSGHDKAGITSAFAELLANTGCEFYDIDQPWCQPWCNKNLSLYFLVGMPRSSDQEVNLIRSLLVKSQRVGVEVEFEIVSNEDLDAANAQLAMPQGLVVTLLKPTLGFEEIAAVARTATEGGFTISKIKRLSTLQHSNSQNEINTSANAPNISAVEFNIEPDNVLSPEEASSRRQCLRKKLMDMRIELGCDLALQREGILRRSKRLVVLDMDSTLIQQEVIDELARRADKYDEVAAVTEAAMRGELDFNESLQTRCSYLKGLPESVFESVYKEQIKLTPGADRFVRVLKQLGYQCAIISGGFQQIAERVKADLGMDYAFANMLEVENGKLTGKVVGAVINRQRKRDLVESLCQMNGLDVSQVVAVGDGANDLDMLLHAGLGIAFNAKPVVQQEANHALNCARLDTVLYMMGISDTEVQGLSR